MSVPGGPYPKAARVAEAHMAKKGLYWAERDRRYKASKPELESGSPCCPRCVEAPVLRRAIYKRLNGSSERLLGCSDCMFLIKQGDILNMGGA